MIISSLSALIASVGYLFASYMLWQKICAKPVEYTRPKLLKTVFLASALHLISFMPLLFNGYSLQFSLTISISLIAWISATALLLTNINKHTEMLGIFIFPIAALTTLLPFAQPEVMPIELTLGAHILLSIIAYSIMGLAAAQAILYSVQEKRFRQKRLTSLFKALPPLQIMEKTLVQLVLMGFIALSFALITGGFFIEDMFAQHLIHKTFFAILSWIVYAIFLWGHFKRGWRGQKAARYTLWAYILLLLSYLGTQLILMLMSS